MKSACGVIREHRWEACQRDPGISLITLMFYRTCSAQLKDSCFCADFPLRCHLLGATNGARLEGAASGVVVADGEGDEVDGLRTGGEEGAGAGFGGGAGGVEVVDEDDGLVGAGAGSLEGAHEVQGAAFRGQGFLGLGLGASEKERGVDGDAEAFSEAEGDLLGLVVAAF